jgi:hypothetical protein
MRRVIRQRIRRTGNGVDLVADINADIAINVDRTTVPADDPAPDATTRRPASDDAAPRQSEASEPGGRDD